MPNKTKNKERGNYGEDLAVNFLQKKGFKILERNFRYSKYGEIDILAEKNGKIHAVEVKTRTSLIFGAPIEAVTKQKTMRIYKTLRYYISLKNKWLNAQIDIISIVYDKNKPEIYSIDFLENLEI